MTETILPCPNPECGSPCILDEGPNHNGQHFVRCSARQNCYHGPTVDELHYKLWPRTEKAKAEAIRLHNLICRPQSAPDEGIEDEFTQDELAEIYGIGEYE